MIGYGPEDNHFVVELTYNYGISHYESGNDFRGITIRSKEAIDRAKSNGWPVEEENGKFVLQAPGGYKYYIINEPQPKDKGRWIYFFVEITLYIFLRVYNRIFYDRSSTKGNVIQFESSNHHSLLERYLGYEGDRTGGR